MPLKYVAKPFVYDQIAHLRGEMLQKLEETKKEIVEQANLLIGAARDLEPTDADGAPVIDFSQSAKEIINRMGHLLNIHDEKLGMLTESCIRRVVQEERGRKWAAQRKVRSIFDVITLVAEQSGEGVVWTERAISTFIDYFKAHDGVHRLAQLVQAVIENSTDRSWEVIRSIVSAFPISSGSEPTSYAGSSGFRKYNHFHPLPQIMS